MTAGVCPYPTMRFVAYEQRTPGHEVFIPDPSMRGRYVLTHRSVAYVVCPHCKSIPGEPCKGSHGYWAGTHTDRRNLFNKMHGYGTGPYPDDLRLPKPRTKYMAPAS